MSSLTITLIGGPTALIEIGGFRLLTDPTFDAPSEYSLPYTTLVKTAGPALGSADIGTVDAVLLSHDHHFDNLDHAGRAFLARAGATYTTVAGAERLGGNAVGLSPGATAEVRGSNGRTVRVTATPARHGPEGGDRGPAIGFVLESAE